MYTLAGLDLTTYGSSHLGGRRRRYHLTTPPGQIQCFLICVYKKKFLNNPTFSQDRELSCDDQRFGKSFGLSQFSA
jgi:hypothetical protein